MQELLEAIKTKWDSAAGAAIRALCPGGLFFGAAPEDGDSANPCVVLAVSPGGTLYAMGTIYEQVYVAFGIFDDDPSPKNCMTIFDALITLFDDVYLSMTNWRVADVERIGHSLDPEPDQDGWGLRVEYKYVIGKK